MGLCPLLKEGNAAVKKRILSICFTFVFLLSLFTNVFAAEENNIKLNHNLTYNGENVVKVKTGDEITVVYTLENASEEANFRISSFTDEIYFDNTFFEYIGDIKKDSLVKTAHLVEISKNHFRVYFNSYYTNSEKSEEYNAKQFIGSFKLKVKATEGTSTISNKSMYAFDENDKKYTSTPKNLTLTIGEEPDELFMVTYKNNGAVHHSEKAKGEHTVIAAPGNKPENCKFTGWKNENDGKIYNAGDTVNITEDTDFTAVWEEIKDEKEYTLTFQTNGGSEIKSITEKENTEIDLSNYTTQKDGYNFDGWYSDKALTSKITSITLDSDKTVYAKWEKKSTGSGISVNGVTRYTLTFETNGGTKINSVSKVKNTTIDLSKYITQKEGYSFDGWHTDKELTKKVTELKITENTTIYAKWLEGESDYTPAPSYKPDIFTDEHYAYIVGRDGGYVFPQSNLTRAEAAEIFYRLLSSDVRAEAFTKENNFTDVNEDDWFNASVSTLANLDILKGRDADTFAPNDSITRAELTTIVARLSEASYEGENLFSDIAGHWAENYINIAASIKWISGDNGKFRPNDNITRAEVVTLINKALNRQPENKDDLLDNMITPSDNTNENAWYYLAVQEAVNGHSYEQKSDGVHEKWTELMQSPDWGSLN